MSPRGVSRGEWGDRGQGGEMAQTMYAYMNKWILKSLIKNKRPELDRCRTEFYQTFNKDELVFNTPHITP
jgi:hypothetical protein